MKESGNVMDMAVGVIVGGAFTAIVTSLNQDILIPILGIFGEIEHGDFFGYRVNEICFFISLLPLPG